MTQEDWRLVGQDYLQDKELYHLNYRKDDFDDHEHCSFCWEKFDSDEQIGYCTRDYYHWICTNCYEDFKELFKWKIIEEESG